MAFGTYDTRAHPRAAVVVEGLRTRGVEVEECNVPLGLGTAERVEVLQKPWRVPLLAARVLSRWGELVWLSRSVRPADAVLVPYMGHFDVHLARLRFPRAIVILDHLVGGRATARDRRSGGLVKEWLLGQLDRAALRAADTVMVDTEEHMMALPRSSRPRAVVVPVGASDDWSVQDRRFYDGGRPLRVVFFGLFTPLQGADVIGRALGILSTDPTIEVTMIGSGQDLDEARRQAVSNPRVRWRGMVSAEELPGLVAEHDVCLGIFGTGDKARRVIPNKVYQGIRSGCAVVTSDTAPQRRVLGDTVVYVPPGDAEALAHALHALAASPGTVAELQAASLAASDRFGPAGVVEPLLRVLGRSPGVVTPVED